MLTSRALTKVKDKKAHVLIQAGVIKGTTILQDDNEILLVPPGIRRLESHRLRRLRQFINQSSQACRAISKWTSWHIRSTQTYNNEVFPVIIFTQKEDPIVSMCQ